MSAAAQASFLPGQRGGVLAWLLALLLLCGLAAAGAVIGYWVFLHLVIGLTLNQQKASLLLPRTMDIGVKVRKPLTIGMNGVISAKVPINNDISIPFNGDYDLDIVLKADIPVQFEIVYQGFLPIDTTADVLATTNLNFQSVKNLRNLTFKARLPMKMHLPVTLRVPVKQVIHLDYRGPLKIHVNQVLKSHLTSSIPARLNVNQSIITPVLGSIQLHADLPQTPVKVIINHADLKLGLDTLRLRQAPDVRIPRRVESPWGDAAAAQPEAAAAAAP